MPVIDLVAWIHARIERPELAARVHSVMRSLPDDVLDDFLGDPTFHLAEERFEPGRGSQVFLAVPGPASRGSRSVILRARLERAEVDFARYVIAHEFAHAALYNGGLDEITDREDAADTLAARWGFPRPW